MQFLRDFIGFHGPDSNYSTHKEVLDNDSAQVSDKLVAVTSSSPDYCRPDDRTTQLTLNHTLTPLSLGEHEC